MVKNVNNPLLGYLLADAPPNLRPASARPFVCADCGLTGGDPDDYRVFDSAGPMLCRICGLGRTAAWEPERVRLLLAPELAQGPLNAMVTLLVVNLLRARAGEPVPAGIEAVLQANLLDALQQRAQTTQTALPCAASAARLRHTLLALPVATRATVQGDLAGLRYLPEPTDPEVARFFNRRRALPV